MRAHSIFEAKGLLKLLKEVKNKLKMLNSSVKLAAEVAAQEALDSAENDDSGREDSPTRGKAKVAKKKKGLKKKPKKTVFRNNFIKESDSNQQLHS